jgi:hypothetical protein
VTGSEPVAPLTQTDLHRLFELLNKELGRTGTQGELFDAVKEFMSSQGDFAPFLELDHLRIMVAQPEYLLAMKCSAMRIGPEFHDEEDIRYLLRLLEIRTYEKAVATITKFYPLDRFPQKTLYALAELLPKPA